MLQNCAPTACSDAPGVNRLPQSGTLGIKVLDVARGHILHIVTDSPQSAVLCNVLTMTKVQCTVLNWSVLDE